MSMYNIIASTNEATVVSTYEPDNKTRPTDYQTEAELEREFIKQLCSQGYEYLPLKSEAALIANLRKQLEKLNNFAFTDKEWDRFFSECIANANEGIVEKTRKIQEDYIQILHRDDGTTKNVYLLDKKNVHNNCLQVINQYQETEGKYKSRYDVTILVNGLPIVHIELKRRGVAIREAFNQINRYQRDSFWAASGLFEYVQIFVISNGTHTKYYSNTTRSSHIKEQTGAKSQAGPKKSNSFEFTSFWADANNKTIPDLMDFTKTFFAKHTLLNIITKYCVFTTENILLVMRPYQIAATERMLNRIIISTNYKKTGTKEAGGYIWHATGSGKTLTSFKAAQLATALPFIDKVLFVVDRKDLDYQTMKEYDRFEKGAANGNNSTSVLRRQLEDRDEKGNPHEYRIIVTTIQKLDLFIRSNKQHDIYSKHIVIIFDECHRSQFGEMHRNIVKHFKNYHIFGFTGTPIFADNAINSSIYTTDLVFGDRLHTYTIVDAINDGNILPFRIDFINTIEKPEYIKSNAEYKALLEDPERISKIVSYTLEHFNQKTKRESAYMLTVSLQDPVKRSIKTKEKGYEQRKIKGFNSIFATNSIQMAINYYTEFKKQIAEKKSDLIIATIFSFAANEDEPGGILPDEDFDTDRLDKSSRDFLKDAIKDYNAIFNTNYDTSADKFQNYYKDVSYRMKNREIDMLIVVDMFLTGFDATTLNTLWVDKNLRQHGLIQAYSRTNRILNSVKTFGNIVCFRDLKQATDEAIALFGNKDASGIVMLRPYDDYYYGYEENNEHKPGYKDLIDQLTAKYPIGQPIIGTEAKKEFIKLYGSILKLRNILTAFDEFAGHEILPERDFQDYQSIYIDLYQEFTGDLKGENADGIISSDIVFEIELIQQIEVNVDYILALVAKYQKTNCKDKEILTSIDKAINSTIGLRNKKGLIDEFIKGVDSSTQIEEDWREFLLKKKEADLTAVIKEERLKPDETKRLMDNAFRDGVLITTGTAIDEIMPPISRFKANRQAKKEEIIKKLLDFFNKYSGLVC